MTRSRSDGGHAQRSLPRAIRAATVALGLALPASALADEAQALAKIMVGNYSSVRQAQSDDGFEAKVRHVTPIWPHRQDGPWLYVEQAAAERPGQPLRQRIVQLRYSPSQGGVELRQFAVPDPAGVKGAWQDPKRLAKLRPEQLMRLKGCEVVLYRRAEWEFIGSTPGVDCTAMTYGAEAATGADIDYIAIDISVRPESTRIWERGHGSGGRQVSGPKSSYRFDKVAIGDVPVTPRR